MPEEMMSSANKPERPGWVSAYVILMWLTIGQGVISSLCILGTIAGLGSILGLSAGLGGLAIIAFGVPLALAAINVVTGIGLWQMKKWGWALEVVRDGFFVAAQLLFMAFAVLTLARSGGDHLPDSLIGPVASVAGPVVGSLIGGWFASLIMSGFILYWFVKNRELFNGEITYKTVVGPDGEVGQQAVTKKTSDVKMLLTVGGGLVLVYILICVAVVAMLAIVGAQIGNVFSQITFELENAPPAIIPWIR